MASRVTTVIHYFGFKGRAYHRILDPVSMYGRALDEVMPGPEPAIHKLLQLAVQLRDFCDKNNIELRPTIGSIGVQFLTDPRFYPKARRKVPMEINERARQELPGNHYMLTVQPSNKREFRALYIDQSNAHHFHARITPLPCANQLYAHGSFINLERLVFDKVPERFYGLHCVDLTLPPRWRQSHWIRNGDRQFVYTNEIPHLLDMGYRINGIYASWGSYRRDTGLARYATWAEKQLAHYGSQPWLKPLLLSTYGTLATRPRVAEAVFKDAKRGEQVMLMTGRKTLTGTLVRAPKKLEPRIANVLHRGMIEAATRSESIGLAQWLTSLGHRVLSIYADAVIVEDNSDTDSYTILPPLPPPWRIKTTLTHLEFINQQAFISGEMTKLPGVSKELPRHTTRGVSRPAKPTPTMMES